MPDFDEPDELDEPFELTTPEVEPPVELWASAENDELTPLAERTAASVGT